MIRRAACRLTQLNQQITLKRFASCEERSLLVKEDNGVRNIVMNSSKTRNALSLKMMEELIESLSGTSEQSLRCIVVSSSGPVFSSGHNLKELASKGEAFHLETFNKCSDLMLTIKESPVPVIAAVNGIAAAAGCQLVASCDIVIATTKSSFSTPGANFGIFCSTPGIALSRNIGRKAAARMLFTGEPVTANEALSYGLVSKVCEEDKLEEEIQKHVNAIKSKSRAVITLGKQFFYEQLDLDLRTAYQWGAEVMTNNLKLADGQEGLKSFVEKRPPLWKNDFTPASQLQQNQNVELNPKKGESSERIQKT